MGTVRVPYAFAMLVTHTWALSGTCCTKFFPYLVHEDQLPVPCADRKKLLIRTPGTASYALLEVANLRS